MPVFTPIPTNLPIRQDRCALVDLVWRRGRLTALFSISGIDAPEPQAVRVTFERILVMRVVDEMIASTEEREKDVGITPEGFAYKVDDSPFLRTLSEAANVSYDWPSQFSFISLDDCLDVIATTPPQFDLVDLRPWLSSMGL